MVWSIFANQISLPVSGFIAERTSSPSRSKYAYALPPATAKEPNALPTGIFHSTFGSPLGQRVAMSFSVVVPSRLGPRYCGQSVARARVAQDTANTAAVTHFN